MPMPKGYHQDPTAYGPGRGGRQYPTDTPLGAAMAERGVKVTDVVAATRIHPRRMTEYLAGRKEIPLHHIFALSEFLRCPQDFLLHQNKSKDIPTPSSPAGTARPSPSRIDDEPRSHTPDTAPRKKRKKKRLKSS